MNNLDAIQPRLDCTELDLFPRVENPPAPRVTRLAEIVELPTHFSHARIIELAGRPFSNVDEMDAELIRRWNETVGPDDVVLHLGDLALGPIAESLPMTARLHGRRFLVPGNHDRVSPATQTNRAVARFTPLYAEAGWSILPEVVTGTRAGCRIVASHYP